MAAFQRLVWDYYRAHGRHDLPWRQPEPDGSFDPYAILVSEIMLQQTQVPRVLPKFIGFRQQFPAFAALAAAPLGDVLRAWSGLGYNRRAKYIWQAAQVVMQRHAGRLPADMAGLVQLPGVGPNTAGAVAAYAFNQPAVFIETNIRSVCIHHFLSGAAAVPDRVIADIMAKALPDNPREWYWALMDYGAHLKQTAGNAARHSAHYSRQSAFAGSRRQIRGQVLQLLAQGPHTWRQLAAVITDDRLPGVTGGLLQEGLIISRRGQYMLPT